jgi:DNA-directed RNA polymerase specialized sigma subunit
MEKKKELSKEEKEKQAKIKLLKQVYWDEKNLKRLQEKLEKITIKIESIRSSNISSMPKSSGLAQDISDLLGQQEEYQSLIIKKIMKLEESRQKAESSIDTLEDSRLKLILNYVYLEDMTFKEIAVDLRKSERHIRRLHDIAIRLMKIV